MLLRPRSRHRIRVGRDVSLGRGVRCEAAPGARIVLDDGCSLGDGTRLFARGGEIRIGAGARLGERSTLVAHAGIDVGAGVALGAWTTLVDFDHVFDDPETPIRLQGVRAAPIRIGAGATLDHRAAVLRGVTVAPHARVAPHAVVTRDVAGVTARHDR